MASTDLPGAAATPRLLALPRIHAAWWEACVVALILGVGLAMRLVNIGMYSGLFDEGIRAEQLFLMSAGYRPFRDIFAAQGPLLLDLLHPWFVLFGQDLAAARLSVGVYSVVGLGGAYWVGRLVGGPLGGTGAMLLLVLSPLYLEGSRLALAEVPAMAPAILAVGAALVHAGRPTRAWLIVTALLLATSLLIKPITLAVCVPVGLALISRGHSAWKEVVIFGALVAAVMIVVVFVVGLAGVFEQIISYRLESRGSEGWSLWKNRTALARALAFEQTALLGLGVGGGVLLLIRRSIREMCLVAWAVASVGLLLAYSPLHGKHAVVMIPPIAIVAGAALGVAWREVRGGAIGVRRGLIGTAVLALLAWYGVTTPTTLAQSGQLMKVTADADIDPAVEQYADAVTVIEALSGPREFVVTDHPYLTFLARRLVPPALVDTSRSRIASRSLRSSDAVSIAEAHMPRLVVLWTDRLSRLREFRAWVEVNYRLVKVYNRRNDLDRTVYVRHGSDLATARAQLAGAAPIRTDVDFAGELRLVSHGLDREAIRRGEGVGVNLQWQSLRPLSVDYHVVTVLRGADSQAWDHQEESLAGGSVDPTRWEVGRWLFQNTFVRTDARVPIGEYDVAISVYDSRARRTVPLADGRQELNIGRLAVR